MSEQKTSLRKLVPRSREEERVMLAQALQASRHEGKSPVNDCGTHHVCIHKWLPWLYYNTAIFTPACARLS